jgi:hypothetical protein
LDWDILPPTRRRRFLTLSATALGGTLIYTLDREPVRLQAQTDQKVRVLLRLFDERAALIVSAASARISPSDASGPGAFEAGVVITSTGSSQDPTAATATGNNWVPVLVISIDVMHALDGALWIKNRSTSALGMLSAQGINYTNASTIKPSDSIPSTVGIFTGALPLWAACIMAMPTTVPGLCPRA